MENTRKGKEKIDICLSDLDYKSRDLSGVYGASTPHGLTASRNFPGEQNPHIVICDAIESWLFEVS